jgi:putative tryptophan/tyrosine transport system substrate-binding protein
MRRREFITLLGGAAAAWPLGVRAQQSALPVVGVLETRSPGETASILAAFREGLKEVGYLEGQNVAIEYRMAEGQFGRLPLLAAELARRQAAVIFAASIPGALAAQAATTTIPIVFIGAGDPVQVGLVASFNRPGGNVTGVLLFSATLEAKKLELLHQLVPKAATIGVLINPSWVHAEIQSKDLAAAARTLGRHIDFVNASDEGTIDTALVTLTERRIGALLVTSGPFFASRRDQLVALAERYGMPAIYAQRELVTVGGLMSYGTNLADGYRQVGVYTGRILKGEKPVDLPVIQPTKFELVINMRTAKTLGLEFPPTLIALADEVIE